MHTKQDIWNVIYLLIYFSNVVFTPRHEAFLTFYSLMSISLRHEQAKGFVLKLNFVFSEFRIQVNFVTVKWYKVL